MPRLLSVFSLALLLSAQIAFAQTTAPTSQQLGALMQGYHDAGLLTGSVLVADRGEILYEGGFGLANASWERPNTPTTRFRIGSLTKQFTAALVLQLVERDELALDAPVTRYLPEYPAASGDQITLHHLLNHTSGIPDFTRLPGFEDEVKRNPLTPDALVAVFSSLDLEFEPGSDAAYSNSGYAVLGAIIERVTGQPYADVLRQRLLAPLNLGNTGYDDGRTVIAQMAEGYVRIGDTVEHAEYANTSWPYAAGMMYSTVRDLHQWTEALYRGDPFQNPETAEQMRTPSSGVNAYGLFVYTQPVGERSVPTIVHGGTLYGFTSAMAYMPDEGRTIVVLDNTFGDISAALSGATALLYGQPVEPPRRPIGDVIAGFIKTEGIEAASARYRDLRENEPDAYDFGESQLNRLGYVYLGRGDAETAVAILTLNVEAFPDASNTYDSLGEAYLAAGDDARAVASYQRALDLDPQSTSARSALAELGQNVDAAPEVVGVAVSEEMLERYVGGYELQPGLLLSISREGDRLFAAVPGQAPVEMTASSETEFSVPALGAQITFNRAADGTTESLTLNQNGATMTAVRAE